VGYAFLPEDSFAQEPARGPGAEGMDGLIGGGEQNVESYFARAVAEASRQGTSEQLRAGIVDQLQEILAIEGKERGMHHLEDASKQGRSFKRTDTLSLEEVSEGVDLSRQFAEGVCRTGAAGAKRIVTLTERGDDVGKRLKGPHHALDKGSRNEEQIDQEAEQEQDSRGGGDMLLPEKNAGEKERGKR
jgi:hypothetical protein